MARLAAGAHAEVGLGAFSTDSAGAVGRLMAASARKRRSGAEPGALRLAEPL
jgi:hypothetical protein